MLCHEYKAGHDIPEMVTNPVNALWALGIGQAPRNKRILYKSELRSYPKSLGRTVSTG